MDYTKRESFKPGDCITLGREFDYKQVFIYEPEVNEKYPWANYSQIVGVTINDIVLAMYRLITDLSPQFGEPLRYEHEGDIQGRIADGNLIALNAVGIDQEETKERGNNMSEMKINTGDVYVIANPQNEDERLSQRFIYLPEEDDTHPWLYRMPEDLWETDPELASNIQLGMLFQGVPAFQHEEDILPRIEEGDLILEEAN